ncbi:MAG: hypothetical protein DWG76_00235 [Chloroflexi bacterium]|nr:hypothetical protein [Chloroflexota bacterium]
MSRSLGPRDWALLNRYRKQGLFLDSAPTLLWGRRIVPAGALLSMFSSMTGVFSAVAQGQDGEAPLIGQIAHTHGSAFAHFTFLAPEAAMHSRLIPELFEHLIQRVGQRGAHSLIAEVDESSPALPALREAGFSIYARQRIWRLTRVPKGSPSGAWRRATYEDGLAADLFCSSLVPGLVQQVEPSPWDGLNGYVCFRAGELVAYAALRSGPRGQWLQPFVHEDINPDEAGQMMADLFRQLQPSKRRPLFICLRSYQAWLETSLRELRAEPGAHQAVVVKRTARLVKAKQALKLRSVEGRRAEPTTPIHVPTQPLGRELELSTYDQTPNYR